LVIAHAAREDRGMAVEHRPTCPVHAGFDPLADDFLADPYAVMAALPLDDTPVFFAPALDGYVVTRHADVESVFLDTDTYSAAAAQMPLVPLEPAASEILLAGGHRPQPSMVSLDPPAHTRLRRPSSRAFTPRRVAEMEPRVRATVAELLDAVDPREPFDIVQALTFPLPATIIFSFMGVPEEDYAQLKEWCGHRATLSFGRPSADEQVEHATSMAAYRSYLRELVARKATDRADDFASALLAIHDEDPDALAQEEIASILFSLSFAGHETTNYLIGNMVRRLLEAPERWDAVVADPALVPGVVEETLRHDTSVPFWRRRTKRAVTLGGVDIPEGATLFLWLAAAGHDPAAFDDPERFDPARQNAKRHLAFGKGIHFCIGSALGKLEAQLALEELTRRFPGLRLVADQPPLRFHPNISFRGPLEMWVRAD
jgi:cytochrome P450